MLKNRYIAATSHQSTRTEMEKVTGIGGFFFRAQDPQHLAQWYEKHLGVGRVPRTYEEQPWRQEAGDTVFTGYNNENEYLARFNKPWIINFRVNDLDTMVRQLRSADIDVDVDPEEYPNGRFALLYDPEGNPIQLWQPEGPEPD